MGALPVFTLEPFCGIPPRAATLTKENLKRNGPSVRTLRSCKTNQMPIRSSVSASRKALAAKLPMRFRVNMP